LRLRAATAGALVAGLFGGGLGVMAAPGEGTSGACAQKQGPVGDPFPDCSSGQVFNVLPAGEDGLVNTTDFATSQVNGSAPANQHDQLPLYRDLVKVAPNLTAADIGKYYKDAGFLADASIATRVERPRAGTVILRDGYDVPHVYGQTRDDTEFGAGYASAEDRLFLMDVLRHVGRATLSSFIGPSPSDLAMDCSVASAAGYTESELQAQFDNLSTLYTKPFHVATSNATTEGQQVQLDVHGYVDGVNAYIQSALTTPSMLPAEYPALQAVPAPWVATDVVATATLVQAIFATGGGNEVASALFYKSLVDRYGPVKGAAIWADFRSQNDPEAISSISQAFPYEQVPSQVDPGSLAMPTAPPTTSFCNGGPIPANTGQVTVAGVTIDLSGLRPGASVPHGSNELIVDAAHSANGHPIAVFGPQVAYFSPEILNEIDLHGPGIHARGASFPGTDIFIELGRGVDYAWSATSAGADIIDQRLEKLCNKDGTPATLNSKAYVFDDGKGGGPQCIAMYERTDTQVAKTSAGATNPPAIYNIQIERTVHGPVIGRTTAIDPSTGRVVPVAVSTQRSTWGDELGASPAFLEWNDPDVVHDAHSWQIAAGAETGTFNWTYVDSHDIAYYMSGKLPIRNPHVDPNFPVWGTGQWEWQGFVPVDLSPTDVHPRAINPPAGFFTNWNNKPAPGFSASDSNYAYGPVYRMQSLRDRVQAVINQRKATSIDVVNAMEDGGTVDLDGAQLVGPIAAVLNGASLTPQQQQVLNILEAWLPDPVWGGGVPGAHRRDRSGSGSYEQGNAVAIMDSLYRHLPHAVFDPWLDSGQYQQLTGLVGINDIPRGQGSAYDGGWEGYLQRSLNQARGAATSPYSQSYCGAGSLAACQSALENAIQLTIDELTATYGTADPSLWTCTRAQPLGKGDSTGQSPRSKCDPGHDDIHFNAVGVASLPSIMWVNRPTWQQVVNYTSARGGSSAGASAQSGVSVLGESGLGASALPNTGAPRTSVPSVLYILGALACGLGARRLRRRAG
jgi:acyl-homoserine lactone acylase PvdQ